MQLGAVKAHPVNVLVMPAELLAVVGRDHHDRVLQDPAIFERIQGLADQTIERGNAVIITGLGQFQVPRVRDQAGIVGVDPG